MNMQQLKAANPIERVAARYGTLLRSGANYKMLCPFHDDHHPSLGIHVGGQYFKCHACGAGGDVVGLVMGLERCSFAEAVKRLGGDSRGEAVQATRNVQERTKQVVPEPTPKATPEATPEQMLARKQGMEANVRFLSSLVPSASGHTELSATWLDFGVAQATAFVPDDYRYLRNRIVFPIYNAAGGLTGFGGRRPMAASEEEPKYVNSPNSLWFDKSRMLYGIHRAAEAIRREGFAYLTEGYKDTLAMHAAGLTNTVALGGTAFTEGQAKVLRGFCGRAVLLLDNDPAGRSATERLLAQPPGGLSLDSLLLPTAKDADELFRRLGRDGFNRYMRLLTEEVGKGEKRLLAFCLKYPEVASHVERMLEEDDLPFTSETYRNLLHFTAQGVAVSDLPVPESLLAEILSVLLPELPFPAGVPASLLSEEEGTVCHELTGHFRLEYYEERILSETACLNGQLRAATPADGFRPALLADLSRHISLLVRLGEDLQRTPVVERRWLQSF